VLTSTVRLSHLILFLILTQGGFTLLADQPALHSAAQLRDLTPEQIQQELPVTITGVVTGMRGPVYPEFFIQDHTGGVVAHLDHPVNDSVQVGQQVMVEGYTDPQQPTPRVRVQKLTAGNIVGLPDARIAKTSELQEGRYDCVYVELTGVIRAASLEQSIEPPRLLLDFGRSDKRLGVWVSYFDQNLLQKLTVDTVVRLRGVCLTWKSPSLQPFSTFIVVGDPQQIKVVNAAGDPWSTAVQSIKSLRHHLSDQDLERRKRVQGVVTLHWPGKITVLQDDTSAIGVSISSNLPLQLGDRVDVAGFTSTQDTAIVMEDASIQKLEAQSLPLADVMTARQIQASLPKVDVDFKPVRITATVQKLLLTQQGTQTLVLQNQGVTFTARLPASTKLPVEVKTGAAIEVTGVCRPTYSDKVKRLGRAPDGFEVWLQDARSITLSKSETGWTAGKVLALVSAAALATIGMAVWGIRARVRMKKRTRQMLQAIRARNEAELLSKERMRLAGDLHDTLSQSMAGAAMQMEVAAAMAQKKPENAMQHLMLAKRLLDRGRQDLRRTVWDLQPSALVQHSLASALHDLAREVTELAHCKVAVRCEEHKHTDHLPERLRSHLFRIAQEALGNAVQHAHASQITISVVGSVDQGITLKITDNGQGFNIHQALGPENGHFGLTSMQERATRLGGAFSISSTNTGTLIEVTVPAGHLTS